MLDSPQISSPIESPGLKRRTNILPTIDDSFDVEHIDSSVCDTDNSPLLNESTPNEIGKSMSTLHIEYDADDLKAQLLQRCGQTDIMAFNNIYSARYFTFYALDFRFFDIFSYFFHLTELCESAKRLAKVFMAKCS